MLHCTYTKIDNINFILQNLKKIIAKKFIKKTIVNPIDYEE